MHLRLPTVCALLAYLGLLGGCPVDREGFGIDLDRDDPLFVSDVGDEFVEEDIVIVDDADVITDPSVIIVEELPHLTLLTFDNFTGFDLAISYFVDDVFQEILVLADETVFIEYPCLAFVELDFEHDYDPVTKFYVGSFDLSDIFLYEGFEYFCGDEILFTFDFDGVFVDVFPPQ